MGEVTKEEIYPTETESLCPVCFKKIEARRVARGDEVFLEKNCKDHGPFSTVIWRGSPPMAGWRRSKEAVHPHLFYEAVEKGCPYDCGLCADHTQIPCSVLLEVTNRCNLHCSVCFADSGTGGGEKFFDEPSVDRISWLLRRSMHAVGPSNLQLSGGEPTLRTDLPEIVAAARDAGYSFIQLNSNGLRLASDKALAIRLKDNGLTSVFLQFDGVEDETCRRLRGRPLLNEKLAAIRNCGHAGLGVILVPTLVKGINTDTIGDLVRLALQLTPTVRGIHFQPISYFGRFPEKIGDATRFTLPELMRTLEEQTQGVLKVEDFSPPGCEHELCSCHASYMRTGSGDLRVLGAGRDPCCLSPSTSEGVKSTIAAVSRRWRLPSSSLLQQPVSLSDGCCAQKSVNVLRVDGPLDLDSFLEEAFSGTFTVSAMAFQDVENIDLERLKGCCISVISPDGKLIPFCAYNLTSRVGRGLYRNRLYRQHS
jgi:7,8-dihydro-6-hydroxymethylpterin dimethyltransferase